VDLRGMTDLSLLNEVLGAHGLARVNA
jgi:hypothetical protein